MCPLCPDEGRGIGLSWLRSSQISSSNRAGHADSEDGDHSGDQVWPFPWTLNHIRKCIGESWPASNPRCPYYYFELCVCGPRIASDGRNQPKLTRPQRPG